MRARVCLFVLTHRQRLPATDQRKMEITIRDENEPPEFEKTFRYDEGKSNVHENLEIQTLTRVQAFDVDFRGQKNT